MEAEIQPCEIERPCEVLAPQTQTLPLVLASPHSGRHYPPAFVEASRLDRLSLRRSEDGFVDEIFASAPELGAPLLRANFPRAYVDANREPFELDPRMFEGRLPGYANTRSMRVAGGLGTIPRLVADGHEIYARKLAVPEGLARVEALYKPYHRTLRRLVERTVSLFGAAVLIDCHSMPSSSLAREDAGTADIVLGDRYGTSCAPAITDLAEDALRRRGYVVARNKPYAGGFITEHYGEPGARRHALQIEINRALYMDERTLARAPAFDGIAHDLVAAMAEVLAAVPAAIGVDLSPPGLAAE